VTQFLESPWMKHIASSKYMVELLRFLNIGRKYSSIRAKFPNLPEPYLLGALEALVALGVVREIEVAGEKFFVLTNKGKIALSFIEQFRENSV